MSDFERNKSAGDPRVERFYSARTSAPVSAPEPVPARSGGGEYSRYTPNEESGEIEHAEFRYEPDERAEAHYTPNEPEYDTDYGDETARKDSPRYADAVFGKPDYAEYDSSQSHADEPESLRPYAREATPDYSAYSRDGAAKSDAAAQPAYAPPKKLELRGSMYASMTGDSEPDEDDYAPAQANVYRPREATWAETARRSVLSMDDAGYSVRDEMPQPVPKRRRRHTARNLIIVFSILAVLGGAGYLMRDKLGEVLGIESGAKNTPIPEFTAIVTPAPVKSHDAPPEIELNTKVSREIDAISGAVAMEKHAVTEQNVITSSLRNDGLYDYYLFSASDGRLLCYFDGLEKDGMFPIGEGCFYVRQSPYLIKNDGSALVRLDSLEASLNTKLIPSAPHNGWFILAYKNGASFNYMNSEGGLLSALWFSRAYPFTGERTAAYVDTGVNGADDRYVLYVLGADGSMTKWRECKDMSDVTVSACSVVYMKTGELMRLGETAETLLDTDSVFFYPDCGAIVARSPETGKFGLFVGGENHYDFIYDSIEPVAGDIVWTQRSYASDAGEAQVCAIEGTAYPRPLSYYFELQKDGQTEYVALSATGDEPILVDDLP